MEISNQQKLILISLLLVLLLPYLYLFGFVHPIADDLGFGYQSKQAPLLGVLINSYKTSNGLYSGNFFMFLFPFSLTDLLPYRLFLVFNFFFFFSGIYFLINAIFSSLQKIDKTLLSLCVMLAVLGSTTHLSEAFYWQTSVVYYQLGLTFTLYYFGVLARYIEEKFIINKTIHQALLLFVLVLIIGIKEPIALIMGFITFLLFVNSLFNPKNERAFFTVQLVVALIFITFLILAPGNGFRLAQYSNNKNFSHSIFYTLMQMGRFSLEWLAALSSIFLVFIVANYHQQALPLLKKLNWKIALFIFLGVLFLCIFPAYWATGILGQYRTLNIASLFLVLLAVFFGIRYGAYFQQQLTFSFTKRVVIFCLVTAMVGNGATVFNDIFSGKIADYDKQLKERVVLVQTTKSVANLPVLTKVPESLFVVDVQPDSTHWINKSYLLGLK